MLEFISRFREHYRQEKAIEEFEGEILRLTTFLLLVLLAGCIASLGLLRGNQAVVIGAMIITPLVSPFVGISLGITTRHRALFWKALLRAFFGTTIFFAIAFLMGTIFPHSGDNGLLHFLSYSTVGWPEIIIALAAGAVAALALASEKIYNRFSGAAIALSLAPPLAVSAIGLAEDKIEVFWNAFTLFGINVGGIIGMSFLVFLLFGFRKKEKAEVTV